MKRHINILNHRGFTLVEIMVAMVILAVSLLSIFHLNSVSLHASARAQKISIGTELARHKMALVLLDIEKGIPKGEFPESKEESGTFEEEKQPNFFWKLSVKTVQFPKVALPEGTADVMNQVVSVISDEMSKSAREVKLTVGWKDKNSEQTAIVLVTHVVRL